MEADARDRVNGDDPVAVAHLGLIVQPHDGRLWIDPGISL